ncbi:uncharacterized protein LOC111067032 [Drosophila obscura]|uniref:uncharacterized protein LOC111067032 n=1 Tax=Drosophila obscura TaxID=7282 RepID=UPI001BB0D866|nr:uncharacterized protein LOC111067032 [Drosophila obscura]
MPKMPKSSHNIVWNPPQVKQLLTLFKRHRNLYDPTDPEYNHRGRRSFALARILLALRPAMPQLSEEDVLNKFGSIRRRYSALTQRINEPGLQLPYWYQLMEFFRPHLRNGSQAASAHIATVSVAKRHKPIKDEHLEALDAILSHTVSGGRTAAAAAAGAAASVGAGPSDDRSASDDSSEDDEADESDASKLDPHHGRSPAQAILDTATSMLGRLAERVTYTPDVEAFGEMLKAEMQSLQPHSRRQLRNKLMAVIIDEGKSSEYL